MGGVRRERMLEMGGSERGKIDGEEKRRKAMRE